MMDLIFMDFLYMAIGILIMKIGYLILFNNLLYIISLQGKKAENTYLKDFSSLLGKVLMFIGMLTSLLTVGRRYVPDHYLKVYFFFVVMAAAFLTIRFFMDREESKAGVGDNE